MAKTCILWKVNYIFYKQTTRYTILFIYLNATIISNHLEFNIFSPKTQIGEIFQKMVINYLELTWNNKLKLVVFIVLCIKIGEIFQKVVIYYLELSWKNILNKKQFIFWLFYILRSVRFFKRWWLTIWNSPKNSKLILI